MQQLFADFPNAVWDPKECFGWRELPRQQGCPSQGSPLLLSAGLSGPTLPSSPREGQLMQTKPTPQNPTHFQSEELPDPASSKNNIIYTFMPIPGFYYQEYYLSSLEYTGRLWML